MYKLFQYIPQYVQHIIDFAFPPNQEELALRALPVDWLINNKEKASTTEFPFIKALFHYKDPLIKELIWQIKYRKNRRAIKCAAYSLYSELFNEYKNNGDDINSKDGKAITLVPIPISGKRRKERGYNQCELITDEIIKFDDKFSDEFKGKNLLRKNYGILSRIKDIEKQTLKNREERLTNTAHIFKVIPTKNLNQKIIIIDDVTTTGSTLKEARDELLRVGYADVSALTIAH